MARPLAANATGRDRLLDAAWTELLHHRGSASRISVASVCAAARCTPPTLYHHFADLSALLLAAGRRAFDDWAERMEVQVGDQPDPRLRLRTRALAYLDGQGRIPWPTRRCSPGRPLRRSPDLPSRPCSAYVAGLLGVPLDDPDVLPAAIAHWAAVHGVASLAISAPAVPEALWTDALDRLVSALTGRPARQVPALPTSRVTSRCVGRVSAT